MLGRVTGSGFETIQEFGYLTYPSTVRGDVHMDGSGESGRVVQPAVIEGRSMAVLYGSETGGAEDIAGELGKTAERLHFQTTVDEMDSFKLVRCLCIMTAALPQADF